ncbi:MAG: VOC family protein [Dehalococcoidia bacterium]|nr:VOC family protein [Dehalococcoidia bacterium]
MNISAFTLNLTSDQPGAMIAFYRDVVGLPMLADMGEGAFNAGPAVLIIDGHSETHGRAKEPQRALIDLFVDDIDAAEEELRGRGVTFLRSKGREFWGGIISTFEDPDGNYLQLIQYDPAAAMPEPEFEAAATA